MLTTRPPYDPQKAIVYNGHQSLNIRIKTEISFDFFTKNFLVIDATYRQLTALYRRCPMPPDTMTGRISHTLDRERDKPLERAHAWTPGPGA